ncbi:TraR/DksA C4-type zinc finger protein [Thalassospira sp. SM2505]
MWRDQAKAKSRRNQTGAGRAECIDCSEPIKEARRKANPHAVRCVRCQSDFERGK